MQINKIFESISGEVGGFPQGSKATFIRMQGCNLNCAFCDAPDSRQQNSSKGVTMATHQIIEKLPKGLCNNVVITGGEPLFQQDSLTQLLNKLIKYKYKVSIETNGSISIPMALMHMEVNWVMDYKLDYENRMQLNQFLALKKTDYIKFVIRDQKDMETATETQKELYRRGCLAQIAYSPIIQLIKDKKVNLLDLNRLTKLIIGVLKEKKLPGILNLQIHKIINME